MFKELVELGHQLEKEGKLPPVGFYEYREPIRWIVHLWPDRIYLEAAELMLARPYSGRTSGTSAHLLADEAAYVFGIEVQKRGKSGDKLDKKAAEKNAAFMELTDKFLRWLGSQDIALREAVEWMKKAIQGKWIESDAHYGDMLSKDWVSFVPEVGPLMGTHLFMHEKAREFWLKELQERTMHLIPSQGSGQQALIGECAICGRVLPLVDRIPLNVKLGGGTKPIHSINADAFTSFQSGFDAFKKTHLGICFECGDTASRAFNELINSDKHQRILVQDKQNRDGLANQVALFWLKQPAPLEVENVTIDLDLIDFIATVLNEQLFTDLSEVTTPPASISQLLELLRLPWTPTDRSLHLNDYAFFLAIVSPNVGRLALRDWFSVSLSSVKSNLQWYLEATEVVSPWGDSPRPISIGSIVQSLLSENPNIVRGLLRTAYLGVLPPSELRFSAVKRLRNPKIWMESRETWRLQALMAAIKLSLFHRKEEASTMKTLNSERNHQAYLCGRLLAILEEAQLRSANFNLNRTLVERYYGAASTSPAATFGGLLRVASMAYFPEVGRDINMLVEEVIDRLDGAGGFPKTLTLSEQAEFALGFYHQRALFRAARGKGKEEKRDKGGNTFEVSGV